MKIPFETILDFHAHGCPTGHEGLLFISGTVRTREEGSAPPETTTDSAREQHEDWASSSLRDFEGKEMGSLPTIELLHFTTAAKELALPGGT
jgi:hypothetical protein